MSYTTEKMKEVANMIAMDITQQGKSFGVDECVVDDFGRNGNFSLICYLQMERKFHNHVWNFTLNKFKLLPIVFFIKRMIRKYDNEGAKLRSHYSPEGIYQSNSNQGMRLKSTFVGYDNRYITIDLDFIPYHAESDTFAIQTPFVKEEGQLKLF